MVQAHVSPRREPTVLLREQIVAAALSLVQEQGLDAITMRSLARQLGYSPASLYMHFRGKEELLREVAAQTVHSLLERIEDSSKREDPAAGLRAFAQQILDFARESWALDRLVFDETPGAPFGSQEEALRGRILETLAGLVSRSIDAGVVRATDPKVATALAWGELRGLARLMRPEGPDPTAAREVALENPEALMSAWAHRWLIEA